MKQIKVASIGYVPPPTVGCAPAFMANINANKAHHEIILFSDHPYPGMIQLKGSPEQAKGAKYANGQPNPWAINNILFAVALKIAKERGVTHMLYLESDCRVKGDRWDAEIFSEFFLAGEGKLIGGSVVCYQPCNSGRLFAARWRDFLAYYTNSPFVIPAYGGAGAAEKMDAAVFPNGALGVYDVEWCAKYVDINRQSEAAAHITAFDYHLGRELVREFGKEAFDRIAHLSTVYSGYKDGMYTEAERQQLLSSGSVVAIHQIKSAWTPDLPHSVIAPSKPAGGESPQRSDETRQTAGEVSGGVVLPKPGSGVRQPSYECVSIYIVTHGKDAEWLKYCLRSIEKFCVGFKSVIVVYPDVDEQSIRPVLGNNPKLVRKTFSERAAPYGQLHHQAVKCMASEFDGESDFFLYVDSDCIFTEPVTPSDYFVGGKPVLLIESYESLTKKKDAAAVWQGVTEKALGFQCPFETMRRHPAVHYTTTCSRLTKRIVEVHGISFLSYVMFQNPTYPQGFSEFNALGSWALKFVRDDYHIIDVGAHPDQRPKEKLIQFWSHGPMDKPQEIWFNGKLTQLVPIDTIQKVLS